MDEKNLEKEIEELLEKIRKERAEIDDLREKSFSKKAELETASLLLDPYTLNFHIKNSKINKIKEGVDFSLINIGKPYRYSESLNKQKVIIPIGYSVYKIEYTRFGRVLFECSIFFDKFLVFSVKIKDDEVFRSDQKVWADFCSYFKIEKDLIPFFGIDRPEIQEKLCFLIKK